MLNTDDYPVIRGIAVTIIAIAAGIMLFKYGNVPIVKGTESQSNPKDDSIEVLIDRLVEQKLAKMELLKEVPEVHPQGWMLFPGQRAQTIPGGPVHDIYFGFRPDGHVMWKFEVIK